LIYSGRFGTCPYVGVWIYLGKLGTCPDRVYVNYFLAIDNCERRDIL